MIAEPAHQLASARKKLVRKMALRLATPTPTPQTWTMDGGA